jgi:large subunit ribosomal protein L29
MQARELRNLSDEELVVELDDAKQELFNLRFQRESGQLEDMSRFRGVKRDVVRILTIVRERELVAEIASQEETGEQ